jgi:hypothetical protein
MERRDLIRDAGVMMTNLDPIADFEYQRPQPEGDHILVQIGLKEDQTVKIEANLPPHDQRTTHRTVENEQRPVCLGFFRHARRRSRICVPSPFSKIGMYPGSLEEKKDGSGENGNHRKTGE